MRVSRLSPCGYASYLSAMDRGSSSSKSNKIPDDGFRWGEQDSIFCSFYRPLTQEALDCFWGTERMGLITQQLEVCTLRPTPPPSPQRPHPPPPPSGSILWPPIAHGGQN